MRNITKGAEPASLTAWRATNPTDYNGYADKGTLRNSLVAEQRGICCYCQCRIRAEIDSVKIEHWQSHEAYLNQRLVYQNLLGACLGGTGRPGRQQHCDTYKGDKDLCRNPANPAHDVEVLLHYLNDGRITSANELFGQQLESVLNLNVAFLRNSRKEVLDGLKKTLRIRGGTLSRTVWERIVSDWSAANHDGDLRPFCNVILYWAKKHLARLP
jgi:uncharacterized protein (TIGR02646 family)